MKADEWVDEVVHDFFSCCAYQGEIIDVDEWVWETVEGVSLTDLDDGELIDLADAALDEYGHEAFSGGVRQGLSTLSIYTLSSMTSNAIKGMVDMYDLDLCDALSKDPPGDESESSDYNGDTPVDDVRVWMVDGERCAWVHVDDLGLWADFTTICPPTAVERLKEIVYESADERDVC